MSSLSDSIKLVITERYSFLKIFALSYLPFVALKIHEGAYSLGNTIDMASYTILGLIYFGYLCLITSYTIQCKQDVLPRINIFKMFWVGLKGIIAIIPYALLYLVVYSNYLKKIDLEITNYKILYLAVTLLLLSIIFTGVIFYSKKFSILEAWNFKNIQRNFSQVFLYIILTFIFLAILCGLVAIPFTTFAMILFGKGTTIYNCIIIYLITTTLFIYFQNLGYAYFEYIKD